jgi:hypothetical protein
VKIKQVSSTYIKYHQKIVCGDNKNKPAGLPHVPTSVIGRSETLSNELNRTIRIFETTYHKSWVLSKKKLLGVILRHNSPTTCSFSQISSHNIYEGEHPPTKSWKLVSISILPIKEPT